MSFSSSLADTPPLLFNSSIPDLDCLTFRTSRLIFTGFSVTHILVNLPLLTVILYMGYNRLRQQCHTFTLPAVKSHSDVFTYHMVAMEMIAVLGCLFYCVGVNTNLPDISTCGFYLFSSTWCAKAFFHTLTCVEHYLAVVHPVTYRGLKDTCGIRIRNVSIGCAWLVSLIWGFLLCKVQFTVRMILFFCHVAFILIVVCYCCIFVLWALRRPRPGEGGGGREGINQMNRRAFNTVVTIMAVLWLCLGGMLVCFALAESEMLSETDKCIVRGSANWFSLPSSLVLPLLYLQRAGKLPGCKHSKN